MDDGLMICTRKRIGASIRKELRAKFSYFTTLISSSYLLTWFSFYVITSYGL